MFHMNINDRYRGDTNPIIMFLYEVDMNGVETPVQLATSNSTVKFSYKKGSKTKSIDGTILSDEGEVHFPMTATSVVTGKYKYDVQVTNGDTGEIMTYIVADMNIKDDITKN